MCVWVDTSGVGVGATARRRRPQPTVRAPQRDTLCGTEKLSLCHRRTVCVPQRHCLCATERHCVCLTERFVVLIEKIDRKHQKWAESGPDASVWGFDMVEMVSRALRSHWDYSRAPKRPKKIFFPDFPPLGPPWATLLGAALKGILHWLFYGGFIVHE